jgi:hypothetical protein
MKKFANHKPKIESVMELFWMFESAFLLGQDRLRLLIEEETKKVLKLRAEIAFVDLKDGVFSIPMDVEQDRCMKLFSITDQFFSTLDRLLPRLREMLQEKENLFAGGAPEPPPADAAGAQRARGERPPRPDRPPVEAHRAGLADVAGLDHDPLVGPRRGDPGEVGGRSDQTGRRGSRPGN